MPHLPLDEVSFDGELVRGQSQSFSRQILGDSFDFKQDSSRSDDRHPEFRCTLSLPLARFCGFLGDRFIGKNPNPHLAATLNVARQGDTRRLNLAAAHPAALQRLQTIFSERDFCPAASHAFAAASLLFAIFDSLGRKHFAISPMLIVPIFERNATNFRLLSSPEFPLCRSKP